MRRQGGYTLIEMTLVLVIIMLVGTSYLTYAMARAEQQKTDLTNKRMDEIQQALLRYRGVNHALPCPASGAATIASQYNGTAAANAGSCTGGTPAASVTGTNLAIGVVPTRTLGLDDTYLTDGWGRRFTYAVDTRATSACSFTNYGPTDTSFGLTVNDASGNAQTSLAWYVLLSHGVNGHGAFMPSGARYSAGSTNVDEQLNCHCDATATATPPTRIFINRAITLDATDRLNSYDDSLRYAERSQIRSTHDELGTTETCP